MTEDQMLWCSVCRIYFLAYWKHFQSDIERHVNSSHILRCLGIRSLRNARYYAKWFEKSTRPAFLFPNSCFRCDSIMMSQPHWCRKCDMVQEHMKTRDIEYEMGTYSVSMQILRYRELEFYKKE